MTSLKNKIEDLEKKLNPGQGVTVRTDKIKTWADWTKFDYLVQSSKVKELEPEPDLLRYCEYIKIIISIGDLIEAKREKSEIDLLRYHYSKKLVPMVQDVDFHKFSKYPFDRTICIMAVERITSKKFIDQEMDCDQLAAIEKELTRLKQYYDNL